LLFGSLALAERAWPALGRGTVPTATPAV
jgi:hypothetical protein